MPTADNRSGARSITGNEVGQTEPRVLIQSDFLDQPAGSKTFPQYLSTYASFPDGTEVQCQRQKDNTYDENVWLIKNGEKVLTEHSAYKLRTAESEQEEDRWTVWTRESHDPTTHELTAQVWRDRYGNFHWRTVDEDGVRREITADDRSVEESDYYKGSTTPFQNLRFKGLTTAVWLRDKAGQVVESWVYRHAIVAGDDPISPLVSQAVRTVWKDGKPAYDQVFLLDKTVSKADSKPPKLVYVFTQAAPLARDSNKRYLRLTVYKGTRKVHMVALASARVFTQAATETYSWDDMPEHLDNTYQASGGSPPKDKTVWTFRKDGSPQFVAQFTYWSEINKLTTVGREMPQSRTDLDPDLDPDYFLADPPDTAFLPIPLSMDIPANLDSVDAATVGSCPKIDPEWLETPAAVPPEPTPPPMPPH